MMKFMVCVLLLAASRLEAQPVPARLGDSSVATIMSHVRRPSAVTVLVPILRRVEADYPVAKLDEIADSLTARVLATAAARDIDSSRYVAAVEAINALGMAGMVGDIRGRAYEGATERLIRIHRGLPGQKLRARVFWFLTGTTDRARALAYLESVASSTDPTASEAIAALIRDASGGSPGARATSLTEREESLALLRDLARNRRVIDRVAARDLELWLESRSR